jgi:HAD superfamily hydrolase (TIGR01490 family)
MIAALFDSDGTLYANQMGRGMIQYADSHDRRAAARNYYASVVLGYALRKLRLMKPQRFQENLVTGMAGLIKGMTTQEGAAVFDWVAHDYLLPTQRADATERLREHQSQGHLVVIISGSFTPCLDLIGAHFGVENLIGTKLEMHGGRYTGRVIPPVITGPAKAEQVREFVAARGVEVAWHASYAYGDSITDGSMLALAGHPVAVYPDAKLAALANERGWEVLGAARGN